MAGGGKKRKASKKKKAQTQQPNQSSSQDNDDLRQQEEKGSDGGDVEALSPASHGAHGDAFPNDGTEEPEDDPHVGLLTTSDSVSYRDQASSVGLDGSSKHEDFLENNSNEIVVPLVEEPEDPLPVSLPGTTKSMPSEVATVGSDGAPNHGKVDENESVEIVKEVNTVDVSESKTVDIETFDVAAVETEGMELLEEKENGVSLNNGSHLKEEKKLEKEEVVAVTLEQASSQPEDVVKLIVPLPGEPLQVVDNTLVVDSIEAFPSVPDTKKVIHVAEAFVEKSLAEPASALKDENENVVPVINEVAQASAEVPEVLLDENEKLKLVISEAPQALARVPEVLLPKVEEAVADMTYENSGKSYSDNKESKLLVSSAMDFVTNENAAKPPTHGKECKLPSSDASVAQARDVAETTKEAEPSENETPVAPLPRVSEKTSWFGCCGIFDVITGSSR